ncbi:MAG: CehA/McbA family metallohydrolase [SAR202 cluster bacterium]|nr:CehA/McbA family metallohydrolase [SAR202 cluster bacterium]
MSDYGPIDLSPICNTGISVLGDDKVSDPRLDEADLMWRGHSFGSTPDGKSVPIGRQALRGLPFLIGPEEGDPDVDRLVEFGGDYSGLSIPVSALARRVIFAHRLLDSPNGGMGTMVATYVLHLLGGTEIRVPIRAQFEIGDGGSAMAAFPDHEDELLPRYEGSWGKTGPRRHEVKGSTTRWFHLWSWENPEPECLIESIEIVPSGPRFVIAAITLGNLDEDPIPRQGNRPARIVLKDPKEAEEAFDLEVEVDRGAASYVHPLPRQTEEEFLRDSYKGWGQAQNAHNSPAYLQVSATPSATLSVKKGDQEVGRVRWGDVQEKGAVDTERLRIELADTGKNWVHVMVVDDETGKPVPCRVHFRSPDGIPYQPYGHHNHVNTNLGTFNSDIGGDVRMGQITYAYIDGTCQGWLPRGEVIVDVARGFEYEPLRQAVSIEPGQHELTLRLKRWTNMNAQGWFSGDAHVHFLSAQGALTEARGEDLNVVNLLQSQWGNHFSNIEDFIGAPHVSQDGNTVVYVCQENRQSPMGHLILWGLKRQVMPWCSDSGSETEMGSTMDVTLSDWADQCHEQGGTVIIPHFSTLNGETVALITTGRAEGIELIYLREDSHESYYQMLNCGYRLPILGGTDKMTGDVPLGMYRTYVQIPEDQGFNYDTWRKNVALGKTFFTSGPMIGISVEGRGIGDEFSISGPGTVEVEAWAESIFPISRLDLVQDGKVVASTISDRPTRRLEIREKVKVEGHTWLAARCGGKEYWNTGNFSSSQIPALRPMTDSHYDGQRRGIFAHTSPVYVACGGKWWMFNEETARHMLAVVEGALAHINRISKHYSPGTVTYHHGEADHTAYLSRPFLEARKAVLKRMRDAGIEI